MSDTDSKRVTPIWTPQDFERTCADARRVAEQAEFDADMDYLHGLVDALFEYGSRDEIRKFAEKDAS